MQTIFLDADGVVLKKTIYFSTQYEERHDLPPKTLQEFFTTDFLLCQKGKADMKEVLPKYLPQWNWNGTVDSFLDEWFAYDVHLNESVEQFIRDFKQQGFRCCLVSNQEKYRAVYVEEYLKKTCPLDHYLFSHMVGFRKESPEFFQKALEVLELDPSDVIYVDNDEKSIEAARTCGIHSYLYDDEILQTLSSAMN
jgi:HAD superfamily hydrolase (TIGR01509 family)